MRTRLFMMAGLLCVILLPQFLYAQNKNISGKVTDHAGNPIPNVSVLLSKSNRGTFTDATGQFILSAVPADATITITSTGYKSQTVKASDINAALSIVLEEDVAR